MTNRALNKAIWSLGAGLFCILLQIALLQIIYAQNVSPNNSHKNSKQNRKTAADTASVLILKVDKKKLSGITIKTRNVSIEEITKQISGYYNNISFSLSRTIANFKLTLDLREASLEQLIGKLAPFAVLEKEITGGRYNISKQAEQIKSVYLYSHNELIPNIPENTVSSNRQVLIFEGNTEDPPEKENAQGQSGSQSKSLVVSYENGRFTIRARKEPIILIAGQLAEQLKIPFTLIKESQKSVDIDVKNADLEKTFQQLPLNLRLKYRQSLPGNQIKFLEMIMD